MSGAPRRIGRYLVHRELAVGGVGVVSLARIEEGPDAGRIVAVKRLLDSHARDAQLVATLFDEARIVAHIHHPNVVSVLEVVEADGAVLLAMDYVEGESLGSLLATAVSRGEPVEPPIAVAIAHQTLQGLHAAHEAKDENGLPLAIVHRDVSPQNILVDVHGVAHVVDFGIAKAVGRMQTTTEHGVIKGKVRYMSPEQFDGKALDRRADVWAVGVVLWEMLAGVDLFDDATAAMRFFSGTAPVRPPSVHWPVASALESVVLRALDRAPAQRFSTAAEMAEALVRACPPAPAAEVGAWAAHLAATRLSERAAYVRELEALTSSPSASPPSAARRESTVTTVRTARRGWSPVLGALLAIVAVGTVAALAAGFPKPAGSGVRTTPAEPVATEPARSTSSTTAAVTPAPGAPASAAAEPLPAAPASPSSSSSSSSSPSPRATTPRGTPPGRDAAAPPTPTAPTRDDPELGQRR